APRCGESDRPGGHQVSGLAGRAWGGPGPTNALRTCRSLLAVLRSDAASVAATHLEQGVGDLAEGAAPHRVHEDAEEVVARQRGAAQAIEHGGARGGGAAP